MNGSATKYTDLSVFYTESRVKIRSIYGKSDKKYGSGGEWKWWSWLEFECGFTNSGKKILRSICLHQHTESRLGHALRGIIQSIVTRTQVALASRSHAFSGGIESAWLREAMLACGQVRCERLFAPCRPREFIPRDAIIIIL